MHRTAEPLRTARCLSEKFGHTRVRTRPPRKCVTMIAISSDDVIVIAHSRDRAGDHCFLANVKMAEAADLLRLILLARAFLETPDQQHQREHLDLVALLGPLHRNLRDARQCSSSTRPAGFSPEIHACDKKEREEQIAEDRIKEKHPGRRGAVFGQADGKRLNQPGKIFHVTRIAQPRERVRYEIEDCRSTNRSWKQCSERRAMLQCESNQY